MNNTGDVIRNFLNVLDEIDTLKEHTEKLQTKETFLVREEGECIFAGTYRECYNFLLRYQHHSVEWALRYEGFSIEPVSK